MSWLASLAVVVCGGVILLLLSIDRANVGGSPVSLSPGGGPSDYCPCGGTLDVVGAGDSWHARCVSCNETFHLDDTFRPIPFGVKVQLTVLLLLFVAAGYVDVIQ